MQSDTGWRSWRPKEFSPEQSTEHCEHMGIHERTKTTSIQTDTLDAQPHRKCLATRCTSNRDRENLTARFDVDIGQIATTTHPDDAQNTERPQRHIEPNHFNSHRVPTTT